jgi:hypothetical protein
VVVVLAAVLLSACHYNPYRWPRQGQPSATALENQLGERDSLQDAAKDLIEVAAAVRDAAQRTYPDAQWAPTADGIKGNCAPPFVFLTGFVYVLPRWQSTAPSALPDAEAIVAAAADALKAHHAENIEPKPGRSVSGVLPREHGKLEFTITPHTSPIPPEMTVTGTTGCHHVAPGPGPWDTLLRPKPTQSGPASPAPSQENGPALPAPAP